MPINREQQVDDHEQVHLEHLHQHRAATIREKLKSTESFDKYLLSFATGSLYLSLFFTKDLKVVTDTKILAVGWIGLLIAIFATLISFLISERAFDKEIKETDKEIEDSSYRRSIDNGWVATISILQLLSLLAFMVGLAAFVIFYFFNLP